MKKIVRSKKTCGGQWRVAGTRLTVAHIFYALASFRSIDVVVRNYPSLSYDDVLGCIQWAAKQIEKGKI